MRLPKNYKKAIFEEKDVTYSYPDPNKKKQLILRSIHFPLETCANKYTFVWKMLLVNRKMFVIMEVALQMINHEYMQAFGISKETRTLDW